MQNVTLKTTTTPIDTITQTFDIWAINVSYFTKTITKLNKRCVRLGLTPITWKITNRERIAQVAKESDSYVTGSIMGYEWRTTLAVTGQSPVVSGYAIAAVIEHTSAGNLLRDATGGAVDLSAYRNIGPTCDHCKVNRQRNETVLLMRADQTLMRVGKSCMKDFLGHSSISKLAWMADFASLLGQLGEMDESGECYSSGGICDTWDLLEFLGWCAAASRRFGYVTRGSAKNSDTLIATCDSAVSEMLARCLNPRTYYRDLENGKAFEPLAEDLEYARVALDWTLSDLAKIKSSNLVDSKLSNKESWNDFQHNLSVICELGYVGPKHVGLAGAILGYYKRGTEWAVEKAARNAAALLRATKHTDRAQGASHVGIVGEKIIVEVVIGKTNSSWSDQWGSTYFMGMETVEGGDLLTWKSSNNPELEPGTRCFIRGTVKEHGEFREIAQTTLNRCKIRCPICHIEGATTKTGKPRKNGAPFKDLRNCNHWSQVEVSLGGGLGLVKED